MGAAMGVFGMGLQAIGSITSGLAQEGSYKDQARTAKMEGREALRLTRYKVRLIQEAGAETLGDVQAETGKAGLAMTGTPLSHLVQTAREVELTAALQRRAGLVEKQRYDVQARALKKAAKESKRSGFLGAGAALFSGLGGTGQQSGRAG